MRRGRYVKPFLPLINSLGSDWGGGVRSVLKMLIFKQTQYYRVILVQYKLLWTKVFFSGNKAFQNFAVLMNKLLRFQIPHYLINRNRCYVILKAYRFLNCLIFGRMEKKVILVTGGSGLVGKGR